MTTSTTAMTSSQRPRPFLEQWRDAVSGSTAGMVSVLALHPLDVIKTRLQVQDHVDRRHATYRGTVHAFRTVLAREGVRGLYAGLSPALIGSTVSWGIYFQVYDNAKERYRRSLQLETASLPSHLHLASAAEAGAVVSLITNPIWVVKTRLALQHGGGAGAGGAGVKIPSAAGAPYKGFFDAMIRIAGTEGLPGLYKGFAPSLFLVSHGAIQFTAYERLKKAVSDARKGTGAETSSVFGAGEPTAFECAWLGVASKLIASVATYPSQVVRSRMQQRGNAGAQGGGSEEVRRRYLGFFQSLRCVARREGLGGLYKGMVPNVLRTLPSSGVTFMVYESTRSFLSRGREED